jgi:hypothetical protein
MLNKTLNQFFDSWQEFVDEIKTGFQGDYHEYVNRLSVRDMLDEFLPYLSITERDKFYERLTPIDAQFDDVTRKSPHSIQKSKMNLSRRWYRIPKILVGDLRAGFEKRGFGDMVEN